MTEWIDFTVYAVLAVSVFVMLPAWAARFAAAALADRNADWLRANADRARALSATSGLRIASMAWAAVGVGVLLAFQLDIRPDLFQRILNHTHRWEALKDLNALLLIPGGIALIVAAAAHAAYINRVVPRADRRHAGLVRRTLTDFVPPRLRLVVYALNAVILAAWLVAAAAGAYSTPKFWGRFGFLILICAAFAFFVRVSVTRPPGVMDRIFGPAFRVGEVRFAFAQQLLAPVIGAVRLYEEIVGIVLVDVNRAMHLGVALLVTAWALRLTRYAAGSGTLTPRPATEQLPTLRRPLFGERSMKTAMRSIVLVILLLSTGVTAQTPNLAGQWQGTLQAGKELRLVFVISTNAAGGGLSGTLHSIDQGPGGLAATVVAQGGIVRLSVAPASITFEGKLSPDGNSIAGTFIQGPGKLPLTLERATKETAWAIPAPPTAMAANAPLAFEVATVKPSNPDTPGKLFTVRGREVMTINTTLADLITFAYGVHTRQIVGGPAWMENDKFDVTGRPQAEGVPNDRQLRGMIRSLLTDRFKLTVHTDKRELPAYVLVVGNRGHKLTPNPTNPNGLPSLLFKGLGMLPAVNATMGDFAAVMQTAVLDRPVVDRTGLQGRFDFTLTWTADESQFRSMGVRVPPPSDAANAPPNLFTAIQEQLGLRFESTNAPVEVVVIDRVERPSEN